MPMTNQEIFDKVAVHLLTQGARSTSTDTWTPSSDNAPRCRYRGDEGRMCAVGCLITDEAYHPDIEGRGATYSAVVEALKASGVLAAAAQPTGYPARCAYTSTEHLLERLQGVHDNRAPADWLLSLRATAAEMELSGAVLDAFGN